MHIFDCWSEELLNLPVSPKQEGLQNYYSCLPFSKRMHHHFQYFSSLKIYYQVSVIYHTPPTFYICFDDFISLHLEYFPLLELVNQLNSFIIRSFFFSLRHYFGHCFLSSDIRLSPVFFVLFESFDVLDVAFLYLYAFIHLYHKLLFNFAFNLRNRSQLNTLLSKYYLSDSLSSLFALFRPLFLASGGCLAA